MSLESGSHPALNSLSEVRTHGEDWKEPAEALEHGIVFFLLFPLAADTLGSAAVHAYIT